MIGSQPYHRNAPALRRAFHFVIGLILRGLGILARPAPGAGLAFRGKLAEILAPPLRRHGPPALPQSSSGRHFVLFEKIARQRRCSRNQFTAAASVMGESQFSLREQPFQREQLCPLRCHTPNHRHIAARLQALAVSRPRRNQTLPARTYRVSRTTVHRVLQQHASTLEKSA